ncbi:MAG: hypothetical protein ACRYFY_13255 [Janthinobacterium lividum]
MSATLQASGDQQAVDAVKPQWPDAPSLVMTSTTAPRRYIASRKYRGGWCGAGFPELRLDEGRKVMAMSAAGLCSVAVQEQAD